MPNFDTPKLRLKFFTLASSSLVVSNVPMPFIYQIYISVLYGDCACACLIEHNRTKVYSNKQATSTQNFPSNNVFHHAMKESCIMMQIRNAAGGSDEHTGNSSDPFVSDV